MAFRWKVNAVHDGGDYWSVAYSPVDDVETVSCVTIPKKLLNETATQQGLDLSKGEHRREALAMLVYAGYLKQLRLRSDEKDMSTVLKEAVLVVDTSMLDGVVDVFMKEVGVG